MDELRDRVCQADSARHMSKLVEAPLAWFGGKSAGNTRGVNSWIRGMLPAVSPGQTYVEPYAGMLGVLLSRAKAANEVANDLDSRIVNFWRVVRDDTDELERRLLATPHSRSTYREAKTICMNADASDASDIDLAWAFTIAVGQAVSGIIGAGWSTNRGFKLDDTYHRVNKWSKRPHAITHAALIARIRDVTLECKQGAEVASYYAANPLAVIYCDPPYSAGAYGYREKANLHDLIDAVKHARARILISGYADDPYDDLLDWHRHEQQTLITTARHGTHDRLEVAWTNYEITELAGSQGSLL